MLGHLEQWPQGKQGTGIQWCLLHGGGGRPDQPWGLLESGRRGRGWAQGCAEPGPSGPDPAAPRAEPSAHRLGLPGGAAGARPPSGWVSLHASWGSCPWVLSQVDAVAPAPQGRHSRVREALPKWDPGADQGCLLLGAGRPGQTQQGERARRPAPGHLATWPRGVTNERVETAPPASPGSGGTLRGVGTALAEGGWAVCAAPAPGGRVEWAQPPGECGSRGPVCGPCGRLCAPGRQAPASTCQGLRAIYSDS